MFLSLSRSVFLCFGSDELRNDLLEPTKHEVHRKLIWKCERESERNAIICNAKYRVSAKNPPSIVMTIRFIWNKYIASSGIASKCLVIALWKLWIDQKKIPVSLHSLSHDWNLALIWQSSWIVGRDWESARFNVKCYDKRNGNLVANPCPTRKTTFRTCGNHIWPIFSKKK